MCVVRFLFVFFQAEDGIRDLVRFRGLGDVYKRQDPCLSGRVFSDCTLYSIPSGYTPDPNLIMSYSGPDCWEYFTPCLLYTSDAADERSSVDLGGRRIIKKKKHTYNGSHHV